MTNPLAGFGLDINDLEDIQARFETPKEKETVKQVKDTKPDISGISALSGFSGLEAALETINEDVSSTATKSVNDSKKAELLEALDEKTNYYEDKSQKIKKVNNLKLFLHEMPDNNSWYVNRSKLSESLGNSKVVHFPVVQDTEFKTKYQNPCEQQKRTHATSQVSGIAQVSLPKMYATKDTQKNLNDSRAKKNLEPLTPEEVKEGKVKKHLEPFPRIVREADFIDYLVKECGFEVKIRPVRFKKELWGKRKFVVTTYAHFATAELNLIFRGTLKERIKELQRSKGGERIEHARRTRCVTVVDGQELDYVKMNHIININGEEFSYCQRFIDTGAIHGPAGYADFCKAAGWHLQHKGKLSKKDKEDIIKFGINNPEDFENYGLGDLDVANALFSFYDKWKEVYKLLGIEDKFTVPKLTIGGTVKDLFVGSLAEELGFKGGKWLKDFRGFSDEYLKEASAGQLRKSSRQTSALLAKVEGGRCRNNRPTDVFVARKVNGKFDAVLICDIDISGCYGEGQRNQLYLVGRPEILSFKVTDKNNKYPTLREWLESYDVDIEKICKLVKEGDVTSFISDDIWGELIPGCWHARFSTFEDLKYPQDYFASWFTNTGNGVKLMAKFVNQMKCDSEMLVTEDVDFDETEGNLKIFNYQVHNGLLNHDGLEWIFSIASKRQRNDMLDKFHVQTSTVYPKSSRIDTGSARENAKQLVEENENWQGQTIAERVPNPTTGKKSWRNHDGECHAWFGVNLGTLLINDLLINRKKAQKQYGKKSPLDLLFKLSVNTLYGDMVSKFFAVANTCTGNNITARARLLCWCMEKGLHGHQSITDGCAFEPTGVLFGARDKIDGECLNLHRKGSKLFNKNIRKGNLSGAKQLKGYWENFTYKQWDDEEKKGKDKSNFLFGMVVDGLDIKPYLIDDPNHKGCHISLQPALEWVDEKAMEHLANTFPLVSILHKKTTKIKIGDDLSVNFKPRKGQFSFETKDMYYEGGFHGSANYILKNPNGEIIKYRGQEIKTPHISLTMTNNSYIQNNRYDDNNSPAKDFIQQLCSNPRKIKRQETAIKGGILKIGDYKNNFAKYEAMKLEPGDNIRKALLLTECSLSQFTFKTYEQWKAWNDEHAKSRDKYKQSLEIYFTDKQGNLDLQLMSEEIDKAIEANVMSPFKHFDKSMHRHRKGLEHPDFKKYDAVRNKLNGL